VFLTHANMSQLTQSLFISVFILNLRLIFVKLGIVITYSVQSQYIKLIRLTIVFVKLLVIVIIVDHQ